jgi:hypothetical protein
VPALTNWSLNCPVEDLDGNKLWFATLDLAFLDMNLDFQPLLFECQLHFINSAFTSLGLRMENCDDTFPYCGKYTNTFGILYGSFIDANFEKL